MGIKAALICALSLGAATSAWADPVTLLCHGNLVEFSKPSTKLGATTVSIDIENGIVKSPLGDFAITRVTDNSLVFSHPTKNGVADGNIDRVSGSMTIFWLTPEQKAASKKGPFKYEMYASLECAPAKRMF